MNMRFVVAAATALCAGQSAAAALIQHGFSLDLSREVNGQPAGTVAVVLGPAVVDVITLPPGPEEQVYQYSGPILASGTGGGLALSMRMDVAEARGQFVPVFPFHYENHLRGDVSAVWDGREYRSIEMPSFRVDTPGVAFTSVDVWGLEAVRRLYLNGNPQAADVLVLGLGSSLTTQPVPSPGAAVVLALVALRRRRSVNG
jgi:hypothetical protein